MISNRIKNLIFEYLLKDLIKVEIIYYRDSVWFIDRDNRYWYFEYHKVDKHLWWRWSHFTTALTMFSMEAEKEQYLLGELVNMILTKKQNLESKYPDKIFKTVGSVMNFEDNDEVVLKNEIKTTDGYGWKPRAVVDEVLNNEIETTEMHLTPRQWKVDDVLNNEVKTTIPADWENGGGVDEVLNYEVEKTEGVFYNDEIVTQEVLDNTIEINSIEKLKGESPFQNIVVSHILNESDKVTDKLKMEEDKTIYTYGHDVYMCDHLVQNVLDVGVNSIHYDAEPHTQLVDGILKKS